MTERASAGRVRAAVGLSLRTDVHALAEANALAREALGDKPAFAIVVGTPGRFADESAFASELAGVFEDLPHAGSCTERLGVGTASYSDPALAVMLVAGDVAAEAFAFQAPGGADELDLPDLPAAIDALELPASTVLAFTDPRGAHVPALPRLVEKVAPGASLVGGGTTAGREKLVQLCQGRVLSGVCAGLAIATPVTPAGMFVAQGAALVGARGVVTKTERGLLLEVDGKPATSLLDALRTAELPVKVEEAVPLLALALAPGGPDGLERGQYVVRNLSGVDATRQAVAVAARMEAGWGVSLCLREAIGARGEVADSAKRLGQALGTSPAGGIYFDCASRGERLYGAPGVDEAHIERAMGAFPLLSLSSSFELGPVFVGNQPRPELHLYSGVLWVLGSGAELRDARGPGSG